MQNKNRVRVRDFLRERNIRIIMGIHTVGSTNGLGSEGDIFIVSKISGTVFGYL